MVVPLMFVPMPVAVVMVLEQRAPSTNRGGQGDAENGMRLIKEQIVHSLSLHARTLRPSRGC